MTLKPVNEMTMNELKAILGDIYKNHRHPIFSKTPEQLKQKTELLRQLYSNQIELDCNE